MTKNNRRDGKSRLSAVTSERVLFIILVFAVVALIVVFYATKQKDGQVAEHIHEQQEHETADPVITSLMQRFEQNPEDVKVLRELGNKFYDNGNFAMAEMFYKKVLELTPDDTDVIVDLGTAYFYTQRGDEAIKRYQEALQIDPGHMNAIFNMGVVKDAMGDREGALVWWRKYAEVADINDPHLEFIRKIIAEKETGEQEGEHPDEG